MGFHFSDTFNLFINEITQLDEFKKVYYYIKSMKYHTHNGINYNYYANAFIHNTTDFYLFFIPHTEIPSPVKDLSGTISSLIDKYNIDEEEILLYTFGFDKVNKKDKWFGEKLYGEKDYVAYAGKILYPHDKVEPLSILSEVMAGTKKFKRFFSVDHLRMIHAFILILIKYNVYCFNCLEDILAIECLEDNHDKYGLTDVTYADYKRQGFTIDDKYYLYNLFFDFSIGNPLDSTPNIINIIQNSHIHNLSIMMRCDRNLCVNKDDMVCTAGVGFEKWRGIDFHAEAIEENLIKDKEIIVHYDPKTMNKLLLIIKPEKNNNGEKYYQISVEQLWSMDKIPKSDSKVITNYIHGCYYPDNKMFDHIDFSVNQYNIDVYEKKYSDSYSDTKVPIGKYGDLHYKIWCIKGDNLEIKIWSQLVYCTLDYPFRRLFAEIVGGNIE